MTSMYSYLLFGSIIYAFVHVMNNTYKACSQGSPVTSKVMLPPSCLPAKFLQKTNQPSQKLEFIGIRSRRNDDDDDDDGGSGGGGGSSSSSTDQILTRNFIFVGRVWLRDSWKGFDWETQRVWLRSSIGLVEKPNWFGWEVQRVWLRCKLGLRKLKLILTNPKEFYQY